MPGVSVYIVNAHCRLTMLAARDSVLWSVKHGVDIIYHASYIDEGQVPFIFRLNFSSLTLLRGHESAGEEQAQAYCRTWS